MSASGMGNGVPMFLSSSQVGIWGSVLGGMRVS